MTIGEEGVQFVKDCITETCLKYEYGKTKETETERRGCGA
jgi:hypothetical protein